jgi:isopentenyldiphosphate isomerase
MRRMNSVTHISRTDRLIYWLYQLISRFRGGLLALLSGFLLGRVTNELSIPYTNWLDIVRGLFWVTDRPANLLTWFSVAILVAVPMLNQVVSRLYKRRRYDRIFAIIVERHKSPSLAPFKAIGWDGNLTLQSCPILHRGWLTTEVKVYHNTARYSIPKEYSQPYQEYFNIYCEEKRFFDDKPKIMLIRNPIAFSDSPTLVLETQETLYSQVQFYRENVAVLTSKREEYIRKAVQELSIDFPHPLCMHLILVTRDDKVLITKRAPKVAYFPGTWSCSVEEQLSLQDVEEGPDNVLQRWFERLLKEELGLDSETYTKENLRVLSVFLESEILAVSICAHAVVDLSSKELSQILEGLPRTDYEFSEWDFLSHEELLDELFHPSRPYHPTSGYRMLMALIKRFGEPKLVDIFFARERR